MPGKRTDKMVTDKLPVNKKEVLENILRGYGALLIAFSGGVDSTLLLAVARRVLGDNVLAVTYASPFHSDREIKEAVEVGKLLEVPHLVVNTPDIESREVVMNPKDRCYYCKKQMGLVLSRIAAEKNIKTIAHGANLDDQRDHRPGHRAAEEMGWVAPLVAAAMTKADIRLISKEMGLPTWNKPAMACLATRIPYGTPITKEALEQVAAAEAVLWDVGFSTSRVRHHGEVARIEVPADELSRFLDETLKLDIIQKFRELGFQYISLDLEGYVQGSMNRGI